MAENRLRINGYFGWAIDTDKVYNKNDIKNETWNLKDILAKDVEYRLDINEAYDLLEKCEFLDEISEIDMEKDFLDFVLESPEFKDKAYVDYIDNLDLVAFYDGEEFMGYDYECDIDIDLLPIYERYDKIRGINLELTPEKDEEER